MKNLWIIASVLLASAFFFGCAKDAIIEPVNEVQNAKPIELSIEDVKSEDGILIFDSWEHLNRVNQELSEKGYEAELTFGRKHNFKSQNVILKEVMFEEEKIEEEYVMANNGNFEGLRIPKSQAYEDALNKGLLIVQEDSDTAHSYYLSVLDPTISRLINEDGFVMVGTELWEHNDKQIKFCTNCEIKDKERLARTTITNDDETIITFTINQSSRQYNSWKGNLADRWVYPSSNKRVQYLRFGWSEKNDNCQTCFIACKYYLNNQAQEKKWGNWKFRNSYEPRFRWNGTWSGHGYVWDVSIGASYYHSISSLGVEIGVANTPMTNRLYNGNNNTEVTLHPHRSGGIPAPVYQDYWETPLNVYNINIDGVLVDNWNNFLIQLVND
jgi:hypothetical protein